MFKALLVALIGSCTAIIVVSRFTEDQIALFLEYLSKGFLRIVITLVLLTFIATVFLTFTRRNHK